MFFCPILLCIFGCFDLSISLKHLQIVSAIRIRFLDKCHKYSINLIPVALWPLH